jgi:N-hydroxyarylamine O-acetyltransferase
MDVNRYLHRIACGPATCADLATLRRLQHAHLHAVPFENLDIRAGRALALDESTLFDKIVVRRRGGICYEQNTLFAALLRRLGFEVALLGAEVASAEGDFGPPFDHMALLVTIGAQRWLVDVGFGDSFVLPLDLDRSGEQRQGRAAYELHLDGAWQLLTKHAHGEGSTAAPSYRFQTQPREVADFEPMCRHHQTCTASHFTQLDICSLPTPTGRVTFNGHQLIETDAGVRRVTELRDAPQRHRALRAHFGVVL